MGEVCEEEKEEELGADDEFGVENEVRDGEEFGEEGESYSVENGETISVSSSNKRIKEMSIDRLSALPDCLIIHILSFLELKETAITSVLSKRWQYLWAESPRLDFRETSSQTEKIREFVTNVHRTLVIRTGNYVEKFEVHFNYDKCFASDVNVWVEFAVKNKVKELSLLLDSGRDFYRLPQVVYSNSSLTWLWMQRCIVAPHRTIEWQSLTNLWLEDVELSQHVIEKLLSGCPVLYSLSLGRCWGFKYLDVNSKSLYELEVTDCEDGESESLQEISAPYIQSLVIRYCLQRRWSRLMKIPSVVKACIAFDGSDWGDSFAQLLSKATIFLENFKHVKELVVGNLCIEVLSMLAEIGCRLPQSKLEHLTVYGSRDEHVISGIVSLLESSPNLETLIIQGYDPDGPTIAFGPLARRKLDFDVFHLKTINITDFVDPNIGGEPMLTLARILLKRATILEKMEIDVEETTFSSKHSPSDFIKTSQRLLNYPRASQKAVVLLR